MFKRALTLAATTFFLVLPAAANHCSELDIKKRRSNVEGYDLSAIVIEKAPPVAPTWAVAGLTDLPMSVAYGNGLILNLDVSTAIVMDFLGTTDDKGKLEFGYLVPEHINLMIHVQAVSIEIDGTQSGADRFSFCTSNPEKVRL